MLADVIIQFEPGPVSARAESAKVVFSASVARRVDVILDDSEASKASVRSTHLSSRSVLLFFFSSCLSRSRSRYVRRAIAARQNREIASPIWTQV